jgi:hypothetical protein
MRAASIGVRSRADAAARRDCRRAVGLRRNRRSPGPATGQRARRVDQRALEGLQGLSGFFAIWVVLDQACLPMKQKRPRGYAPRALRFRSSARGPRPSASLAGLATRLRRGLGRSSGRPRARGAGACRKAGAWLSPPSASRNTRVGRPRGRDGVRGRAVSRQGALAHQRGGGPRPRPRPADRGPGGRRGCGRSAGDRRAAGRCGGGRRGAAGRHARHRGRGALTRAVSLLGCRRADDRRADDVSRRQRSRRPWPSRFWPSLRSRFS